MPIYEYRCGGCKRKVSLFFPSISAAERRTAANENRCPRCDSGDLMRLMSKIRTLRHSAGDASADSFSDSDDFSDMDGMDDMGMGGMGDLGIDDEDPRAIARWARQMKEQMGPEMDLGPDFDRALSRIEAGEDPDRVMDDMDPEALGGAGGDDEEFSDV